MDPASATGIGLAVISLAAQCFTGYMQALELISNARNLKPQFKYLSVRLRLEQQRTFSWAAESGLLTYVERGRDASVLNTALTGLNRTAILEVLVQMETLAVDFVQLKGRYEPIVPEREPPISQMDHSQYIEYPSASESDASMEMFPDIRRFLDKAKRTMSAPKLPKKLRWAAIDKDRYEALVDKLKELNDVLLNLIDHRLRVAVNQNVLETKFSVLQLHDKIDDLTNFFRALIPLKAERSNHLHGRELEGASMPKTLQPAPEYMPELVDRQLADLARFKIINESIESGALLNEQVAEELHIAQQPLEFRAEKLKRSQFMLSDKETSTARRDAVYIHPNKTRQRVWVEWKSFTPIDGRLSVDPKILDRIQKLSALLCSPKKPTALRVAPCLGYFDDSEWNRSTHTDSSRDEDADHSPEPRFGFVFAIPDKDATNKKMNMLPLRDLINWAPTPSLTQRIALARAIANCLFSLHAVNWLHKGFRSANILFAAADAASVDYADPFISGFDYARPAQTGEMTEMPSFRPEDTLYRHPDAHGWEAQEGSYYRKSFDIYSLGVVLVEVARWQSIDAFLKIDKPRTATTKDIRRRLLEEKVHLDAVAASAGDGFREATRACLSGGALLGLNSGDDETDNVVAVKLSRAFSEKVIKVLESISI